ncbi:MAG: hypothetical protein IKB07_08175 [Lachnospiraceae bacterium]|nr:hypothetical protein [Lachnospiraceae bacterium]
MYFPQYVEQTRGREMTTAFGGYNHTLACADGEFYDMRNMTSRYFPVLSPRRRRGVCRTFENPQGLIEKESLVWVDNGKLYLDGEEKEVSGTISIEGEKTIAKMGAYIVIFPDKVWYNTSDNTSGEIESRFNSNAEVTFSLCDASGKAIVWHDEAYYKDKEPETGDYLMSTINGKSTLRQWSSATSVWVNVNTTYIQISQVGIGKNFKKEDGIKITLDLTGVEWTEAKNIFVNDEGDGKVSINTCITDLTDDCITIVGLLGANKTLTVPIEVVREVPDMEFVTECNNRLWGCSADGHEVYCCKLGDVTNWKAYAGISTDSWAATIGSDGKFTGATTYLGNPIFFKEDCMVKVIVSSTGAHRTVETYCRGVQRGSHKSLCIVNEVLYYKSADAVCAYGGSQPQTISNNLGEVRYLDAVGGTIGDEYYISMKGTDGKYALFVYDTKKGLWCKEDDTAVMFFCRHDEDLYYVDSEDKKLKSVFGTIVYDTDDRENEKRVKWMAESGNLGFSSPDNKYVGRINIRLSMEIGASVDFYLQYDSCGEWDHIFNMSGKATKTFTIPVMPRRCDHFKYRLEGTGDCKIYSVTKTIEEGSDV